MKAAFGWSLLERWDCSSGMKGEALQPCLLQVSPGGTEEFATMWSERDLRFFQQCLFSLTKHKWFSLYPPVSPPSPLLDAQAHQSSDR